MPINVLCEHDWGLLGRCCVHCGFQNAAVFDCMRRLYKRDLISGLQCSQIDIDTYKSSDNPRETFVRVVDVLVGYTRFGSIGDSPVTSVPSEYST